MINHVKSFRKIDINNKWYFVSIKFVSNAVNKFYHRIVSVVA